MQGLHNHWCLSTPALAASISITEILSIDRAALLAKLAESLTLTVQLRIEGSCLASVVLCLLALMAYLTTNLALSMFQVVFVHTHQVMLTSVLLSYHQVKRGQETIGKDAAVPIIVGEHFLACWGAVIAANFCC